MERKGPFAYYTASKSGKYLTITTNLRPVRHIDPAYPMGIPVDGKHHARKVSKQHGATDWNY